MRWRIATAVAALVLCLLQLRWQALDHVPPAWDQAGYLLRAVRLFDAGRAGGWHSFIHQIFYDNDRGRAGLITILVQPFFALLGVSLRTAMIPYALLWLVAGWAMSGIAREAGRQFFGMPLPQAATAGFLAFLLFAANPLTMALPENYLVEFPLVVFAAVTLYAVLAYRTQHRTAWLVIAGAAVGLGMLTKVTFPVFLIPAVLIHGRTWLEQKKTKAAWRLIIVPVVVAAAVCGPIYVVNFRPLVSGVLFLSSARLGHAMGLPGAFELSGIAAYIAATFASYENILTIFAALGFCIVALKGVRHMPLARFGGLVFASGFLIPFVIVGLGTIKEVRYSYVGWINLFALAGLLLVTLMRTPARAAVLAALFVVPLLKFAVVNGADLPGGLSRDLTILGRAPDANDHRVDALVSTIAEALRGTPSVPAHVITLAGTTEFCHGSLLIYTALRQGNAVTFEFLPAFIKAGMTQEEAMAFLRATPHDAILYKTGETIPPTFMALDAEVVRALDADPAYWRTTLPFAEPEGCAYDLFIKKRSDGTNPDPAAPAAAGP